MDPTDATSLNPKLGKVMGQRRRSAVWCVSVRLYVSTLCSSCQRHIDHDRCLTARFMHISIVESRRSDWSSFLLFVFGVAVATKAFRCLVGRVECDCSSTHAMYVFHVLFPGDSRIQVNTQLQQCNLLKPRRYNGEHYLNIEKTYSSRK